MDNFIPGPGFYMLPPQKTLRERFGYRIHEICDALVVTYHVALRGSRHVPRERDVAPPQGWSRYEVRGTASGAVDSMFSVESGLDRSYERAYSPTLIGEFFAPDWNTAKRIYNLLRVVDT